MRLFLSVLALLLSSVTSSVFASDAKTYVLMPVGTDLTEFRIAYSEVTSPSVTTSHTYNQTEMIKHTHYFDVAGQLGAAYFTVPYTDLKQETKTTVRQSGSPDPTILLAMGVYNTPALSMEAYKKLDKNGVTAACSIAITVPLGSYDSSSLLNTGGNRYTEKPECQIGFAKDKFLFEMISGFTHYGSNSSYAGNNKLTQDNLYHFETHTSYNFTPRLWTSFDTFYVNGGNVQLNGRDMNKSQNSISLGLVTGYMINKNQMIKVIYQNTVKSTSTSTKLQGFALSYNYLW